MALNTGVRSLLIPVEETNLLLPGTVIAEIIPYVPPAPPGERAAPNWLLGSISWREQRIPLISFDLLTGDGAAGEATPRSRVVVLKGLSAQVGLPFYGIVSRQIPRLLRLQEESLELVDAEGDTTPGVQCQVLADGESAAIPDLPFIEQQLAAVMDPWANA
jgi:chemosensory pili system protein ChpC